MKKLFKSMFLLIAIISAISILAACGAPPVEPSPPTPEENEWKPVGSTVTVTTASAPSTFAPIFGTPAEDAQEAMNDLIALLSQKGLQAFSTEPADASAEEIKNELIIGSSNRKASVKAKEFLDEKSASTPNDLHWVFHYYDGKLAIIANSPEAYEKALASLSSKYINNGVFSFTDTLKEHGTVTRAAYEEELEEIARIEAEIKKQECDALLAALLPLYEAQRDDITAKKSFGTATANIGTSSWAAAPTTPIDEHPRVFITADNIPLIRERLKENNATNNRFRELLDYEHPTDCRLGAPTTNFDGRKGVHNYDKQVLELIQTKALGYLVEGHDLYGYQAIYYMKNFLLTLDIQYISSDQCREYGNVMMTAAIVYDWCYDLLTEVDKAQFIAAVETRTASGNCGDPSYTTSGTYKKKMEVGFPPSGQGSVSGHGSEGQILRNYLAAAIAFYGDNNSWWNYVAARVYSDYIVTRNYYYQSGISQQGTGLYIGARHTADLFSAWLLKVGANDTPYVNIDKTIRNFLGYECAPDQIFTDGDGTYETRGTSLLVSMAHISGYLFGDAAMVAQAEHILGDGYFGADTNYLDSVLYVALRGISSVEASEDRYDGMSLIQYNGHPVGQYIIREAWNSNESAAVFMKIKERNTGNHEHEDAGTFEIYYKGMLTSDGGCYNSYGSEHTAMYHQATISHNGIIIFNPSKWDYNSTDKTKKWYSGSQNAPGEASNLNNWLASDIHTTGKVTGRQHAYSDKAGTQPLYAYIAGDITKAYPSDTASYVGRRMITIYTGDEEFPMAFFVYDDITSRGKSNEKRFLLQISSTEAPVIGRDTNKNDTVTTENGDGKLVLTVLGENAKINPVGGRVYTEDGKYSSTLSSNYLINGYQDATTSDADDKHWGRVEIVWDKDVATATFLNVIHVTDKGNENAPTIRGTASENDLTGGVFDKRIAVLFATSRSRATTAISCKTFGSDSMSYYVSGVAAGKWTVTVGGKTIGTFEATEEGGLLTFTAPAGKVVITPQK